jgi:hypothetical protein
MLTSFVLTMLLCRDHRKPEKLARLMKKSRVYDSNTNKGTTYRLDGTNTGRSSTNPLDVSDAPLTQDNGAGDDLVSSFHDY